jgi:RNA-directed DNA polymerase
MPVPVAISALARSLSAGDLIVDEVHARAARTLGRPWRWLRPLAVRYVEAFAAGPRPRHREVVRFLIDDSGFAQARAKYRHEISVAEWIGEPRQMQPVPAARGWNIPPLESVGDLAAWLSLSPGELDWFADLKGLGRKLGRPKLEHYHYRILPKRSGGFRLTESPKPRVKELQRRILFEILDRIPAHHAVHGFVKGRSIVSFATPHAGKVMLLRLDLQDFFPTFPAARVQAVFRTLGYPESVADRLGAICTNAVPRHIWSQMPEIDASEWREARELYAHAHLPQGAPTSPALANLMAYRLDCRLSGLARSAGAVYTRYADDLAFSGGEEFHRVVDRFSTHAAAVALEEGFHVNHRKTRVMRQGVRQHLAGLVVNRKLSLQRRELELLEAILTNCARLDPVSQNRSGHPNFRAHLEGRIGFVEMVNRAKGQRIRMIFDKIRWES